jgi:hypothetical protein
MAAAYPSGLNTFVPSFDATGQLVVGYSRNPKDFPLNRYITIVPVKRSIGYFLKLTAENAARILNSNLADVVWNDGSDAPSGEWNTESHNFIPFTTQRYAFPFRLGYKAIQQADWKILATHAANVAQQAMTGRALNTANLLLTSSNWSASHVSATGSAITGSALNAGTSTNPVLKQFLNYAGQLVQQDTLGVVRPRDLVVVISPSLADSLSRSAEVHDYLARSPFALAQVRGDAPNQNGLWGLPDALYGFPIIVEDTVWVPYRKNFTATMSVPTGGAAAAAAGGNLTAATYFYKVTALFGKQETQGSAEFSGTTATTNLTLNLTWTAVPYATAYRVYRGTTTGNENKLIATVAGASYADAGPPTNGVSATPPTSGTVTLRPTYMWNLQANSLNPLVMLARPGGLVAQGTSTFSTIMQFMFEEMTVESRDDPDNRRTMGRVVEDYATGLTSDISGYLLQDALS